MAKSSQIHIRMDDETKARIRNYLANTSKDPMSIFALRMMLQQISQWEEREALRKKQLGEAS